MDIAVAIMNYDETDDDDDDDDDDAGSSRCHSEAFVLKVSLWNKR